MRFREPSFERRIKKLARHQLKLSKTQWKEYKRLNPNPFRNMSGRWVGVLWVSALVLGFLSDKAPEYSLFAITLYGMSAVLNRSIIASDLLYQSLATFSFMHLPVSDSDIFKAHIRYLLKSSLLMLLIFCIGYGFSLRSQILTLEGVVSTSLLALVQWATCCSAIMILVPFLPQPTTPLRFIAYGLGFAIFFTAAVPYQFIIAVHQALLITPAGSLSYFVSEYLLRQQFSIVALLPTLAYFIAMPIAYRHLRRSYNTELLSDRLFGAAAKPDSDDSDLIEEEPALSELQPPEAERVILTSSFEIEQPGPQTARIDRFIFDRLNLRERTLCNFLTGGTNGGWAWHWLKGTIIAIVTVILAAIPYGWPEWIVWIPGILAVMFALPILGGTWIGFQDVPTSGKLSPVYAAYPVGYAEISRLLVKVNTLRILLWTPFYFAVWIAVFHVFGVSTKVALSFSAISLYAILTFQPLHCVGKFSKGSNDSKISRIGAFFAITAMILGVLAFAGLLVCVFAFNDYRWVAAAILMPICSLMVWAMYGWIYNSTSFDLIHDVQR